MKLFNLYYLLLNFQVFQNVLLSINLKETIYLILSLPTKNLWSRNELLCQPLRLFMFDEFYWCFAFLSIKWIILNFYCLSFLFSIVEFKGLSYLCTIPSIFILSFHGSVPSWYVVLSTTVSRLGHTSLSPVRMRSIFVICCFSQCSQWAWEMVVGWGRCQQFQLRNNSMSFSDLPLFANWIIMSTFSQLETPSQYRDDCASFDALY